MLLLPLSPKMNSRIEEATVPDWKGAFMAEMLSSPLAAALLTLLRRAKGENPLVSMRIPLDHGMHRRGIILTRTAR